MERSKEKIIGLIVVVLGIIWFGNSLDLWMIDIFFKGWWTLFIIIPSIGGLFQKDYISAIGGLIIGTLLLLASNDIVSWSIIWEALFPLMLILFGLSLMFKKEIAINKKNYNGDNNFIGIFSGNDAIITDKFDGGSIIAVMGGVTLNLRKAKITDDITIDAVSVMGGIDIIMPEDVNVKVTGLPILGGVDNNYTGTGKNTITINYVAVMSGIDVK